MRAKTVLLIQFGTPRPPPAALAPHPTRIDSHSSRTRVTELPTCPRYRFSFVSCAECPHAVPSRTSAPGPAPALAAPQRWDSSPGVLRCSSRRYSCASPIGSRRRMLLSVRRLPPEKRMRKNVRIQATRISLARDKLRQAAYAYASARLSRRSPVSSPRPRRARPPLESERKRSMASNAANQ
jgi:hypothetical protein